MIEPSDEHFQIYKFSVKDFQDMVGVKGNMHTYIKRIVTGLQEKTVTIPTKNSTLVVNWLASAEYFDQEGYIELEISNKLKPYLLGLKERFTSYHLQYILKLNSFYSMRLYELLKQYQFIKNSQIRIDLDVLRDWLGLIEDDKEKYKQFGHFNAKVLKIAEAEINEKTDVFFSYQPIKQARKVVAIEFTIKRKEDLVTPSQIIGHTLPLSFNDEDGQGKFDLLPEDTKEFHEPLLSLGVSKKQIEKILISFPPEQIQKNIDYVIKKRKDGSITKSLGGFTYKAITEDWAALEESVAAGLPTNKQYSKTRTELIPDWFDEVREQDRIRKEGTLEEKRQLYWSQFKSQEDYETYLDKVVNLNERLSKPRLAGIKNILLKDMERRKELEIDLIKPEEFIHNEFREMYKEALEHEKEPV